MAKRRKKRQSSKCPEPFNTMLDLAGAAAIDYIHYKHRQKSGGRRTKIDPYAAAGIAMGMGKINSTESVIALGGILGAMGTFDEDGSSRPDNRYAWRLNCEDGRSYGVDPKDFETREEYNDAVHEAKLAFEDESASESDQASAAPPESSPETDEVASSTRIFCRVSRLDNGANLFYFAPDDSYKIGERVIVPKEDGSQGSAIILSITFSPPASAENIQEIIDRDDA